MFNITMGAQCTLEQFMKHESRDFYNRFIASHDGSDVTEIAPDAEKDEGVRLKAQAAHSVLAKKWMLGKALTADSTFKVIFGSFYDDSHFDVLRQYVSEHVRYHEGFEELYTIIPEMPLYPYLAVKLHDNLEKLIVIDWRVWLIVQIILIWQASAHYFYHVAVVEILPVTVGIAVILLTCQFIWTNRRARYVINPANTTSSPDEGRTSEQLEARQSIETYILWLQQLNLFFLCFSAARLIFSSFFWHDYFRLSCCMLALFLVIYCLFLTIGSLTIPMFMIMFAVPPHVTREDRDDLMKIVLQHSPESPQYNRNSRANLKRGDLRRCSATFIIP
jgi:hypothetical protein